MGSPNPLKFVGGGIHPLLLFIGLHVCAMDCNPRLQLIHICVSAEVWTAIPESKGPQVFFRGTKMNVTTPKQKQAKREGKKYAKKI